MKYDRLPGRKARRILLGVAAAFSAGVGIVAATDPAGAAAVLAAATSAVTCATTAACVQGANTGSGSGVSGSSSKAAGVSGTSTSGQAGVIGFTPGGYGVYGHTQGAGYGVVGYSPSGYGVYGTVGNFGYGVVGYSTKGFGVLGSAGSGGYGVVGNASGSGAGVSGSGDAGYGILAKAQTGHAVDAHTVTGVGVNVTTQTGFGVVSQVGGNLAVLGANTNGNGADFAGSYIGLIGRAPADNYPLVLTDSSGNNVFVVDGVGDVFYSGSLNSVTRTAGGATLTAFTSKAASPTVEDTGTAQLVAGSATVRIDPTFAASVDARSGYRVLLTPNGDTRGLFVAAKTASGFIVRESQGGRATVTFDYRIVGTTLGDAGRRIAIGPQAGPRAPLAVVPVLHAAALPSGPAPLERP